MPKNINLEKMIKELEGQVPAEFIRALAAKGVITSSGKESAENLMAIAKDLINGTDNNIIDEIAQQFSKKESPIKQKLSAADVSEETGVSEETLEIVAQQCKITTQLNTFIAAAKYQEVPDAHPTVGDHAICFNYEKYAKDEFPWELAQTGPVIALGVPFDRDTAIAVLKELHNNPENYNLDDIIEIN